MNWIKNIMFVVIGMLIVLFYWKGCNPCPEVGKSKIETVYVPGKVVLKVDSIWHKKYFELLNSIPQEKPLYSGNIPNAVLKQLKKDSLSGVKTKIRRFTTFFNDVNDKYIINGKITSLSKCKILSTDVNYNIKSLVIEKQSLKIDTIKIKENNYVIKNNLWVGIETSVNPFVNHISGKIFFTHKNGWSIGYRYENHFNYSNTHNIGISKIIF